MLMSKVNVIAAGLAVFLLCSCGENKGGMEGDNKASSVDTAAVDGSGLRTVEGLLTIGHEVRSLEVEGDTCDYWIVDKTGGELYRQYDSLTLGVKNGQTVYARLQVVDGGNAGEGFAEGYDKILQVVGVDSLQSL